MPRIKASINVDLTFDVSEKFFNYLAAMDSCDPDEAIMEEFNSFMKQAIEKSKASVFCLNKIIYIGDDDTETVLYEY